LRSLLKEPDHLRALEPLEQAGARGALLLDRLRVFGRQQALDAKPMDINALVAAGQAKWRDALRPGLLFALELAPGAAFAEVDAAQLEVAVLNLLSNAADATPDGGTIVVSTGIASLRAGDVGMLPAGDYVTVSVRDTGTGMPPDVAARAIEPFFTTKAAGKGTGTGLSQVYGMVQQSAGDLAIASAVGEGTTVTLYFPAIGGEQRR
jgi:signal transduction histidine kinase